MTPRRYPETALGKKLVQLREKRHWTQCDLADYSRLSRGAVQGVEQGRIANPYLSTLTALSQGLGIGLAELVGTYDPRLSSAPPPSSPTRQVPTLFDLEAP